MDTLQFWKNYHSDVKRFIHSKVKDEQITNDLMQETFLKIHLKKDNLKDATKAKSWVFTVARNIVFDHFKNTKSHTPISNDTLPNPVSTSYTHSEKDCLPGLIKNLPKIYREPLFLYDVKGIKQSNIAIQLQRPLATIKSQIQRGRKLIIKGYMDCCDYTIDTNGKLVGELKDAEHCKICCTKG